MLQKIKQALILVLTSIAAIFIFLFKMEKTARRKAQDKANRLEAEKSAAVKKNEAQKKINGVVKEALENPVSKKRIGKHKDKIIPLIAFLVFVSFGCARVEYIPVTDAPDLFLFPVGIDLVSEDGEKYCTDYDGAQAISTALKSYHDEVTLYMEWKKILEVNEK